MATTLPALVGSPYAIVLAPPEISTLGFVENVGFGVKIFVTAFAAMVRFYAKYRSNIVIAAHALDTVPPVLVPPLGTRIIDALDAVFLLAPEIAKLNAPGAG